MDILNTKIKNILTEKNTKIKPENIKKDVTIFNIIGAYEGEKSFYIDDASFLFYDNSRTSDIDNLLSICKNVTKTDHMFQQSQSLTSLDLSNFDMSEVASGQGMFTSCNNLVSLVLPTKAPSKITNCSSMFTSYQRLVSLDLSKWDVSNCNNFSGMFSNCSQLTNLNLSNWKTTVNVSSITNMFRACNNLSDESLNSILGAVSQFIINNSLYKTLKYIGLSQTQAEKCITLSNWSLCENAGWTTGY